MRESRCMSLLTRTTLHGDSEHWYSWIHLPLKLSFNCSYSNKYSEKFQVHQDICRSSFHRIIGRTDTWTFEYRDVVRPCHYVMHVCICFLLNNYLFFAQRATTAPLFEIVPTAYFSSDPGLDVCEDPCTRCNSGHIGHFICTHNIWIMWSSCKNIPLRFLQGVGYSA